MKTSSPAHSAIERLQREHEFHDKLITYSCNFTALIILNFFAWGFLLQNYQEFYYEHEMFFTMFFAYTPLVLMKILVIMMQRLRRQYPEF